MFHFFFFIVKYCASLRIKMPNVANYPVLITWCKIAAINWLPLTKWNETSVSYKRIKSWKWYPKYKSDVGMIVNQH